MVFKCFPDSNGRYSDLHCTSYRFKLFLVATSFLFNNSKLELYCLGLGAVRVLLQGRGEDHPTEEHQQSRQVHAPGSGGPEKESMETSS